MTCPTWMEICNEVTATLASFQCNPYDSVVGPYELLRELRESGLAPPEAVAEADSDGASSPDASEDDGIPEEVRRGRTQKQLMLVLKQQFAEDLTLSRQFNAKTDWKWLNQLLAVTRLKELTVAKVVVKGRKGGAGYDLSELLATFYGKQIVAGLKDGKGKPYKGSRRRIVDKSEFETIKAAFAKIKLTLPEAIEPTKTELFFAPPKDADAEQEQP